MRVPLGWLAEYVELAFPLTELVHLLTMSGTEVGGVERWGETWEGIMVGRVESLHPHPFAPQLVVATVGYGGSVATVVAGAPGLQVGDKVAYARPGARVLDPQSGRPRVVELASVKGVDSFGMLCSERELGLSEAHEAVLVLPPDVEVGRPLADVLGDTVLDLEVTPNRPDCLGVLGVAREVAALTKRPLRAPDLSYREEGGDASALAQVEIQAPDLCARYTAAIVQDPRVGSSPLWMRVRLAAAGVRPINSIVDITNYVMLEYGQPLHAFDYERLRGRRIAVRRARPGETLRTLDGIDRSLSPEMLVIADAERPVALAGIMGGAESEVTSKTRIVLLESAHFNPASIRRTCRLLRLRTEASIRFDKGLSPAVTLAALRRATSLLVDLCGGAACRGVLDVYPAAQPPAEVRLTTGDIRRILGVELTVDQIREVLERLEFACREEQGVLIVRTPDHRTDIRLPADLAEEVARVLGYDTIPTTTMAGPLPLHPLQPMVSLGERVRDLLVGCGLQEVITYSLVGRRLLDRTSRRAPGGSPPALRLTNPLTPDQEFLRTSLLPSLLDCAAGNLRRGEPSLRLFEIGRVYLPRAGELPEEREVVALALAGARWARHWDGAPPRLDLYDLKGVIEELFDRLGFREIRFVAGTDLDLLHPGRAAIIEWKGKRIGVMGELHPAVARNIEVRLPVFLAELDLQHVLAAIREDHLTVAAPPRFPSVRRDLAVVVDESVAVGSLLEVIRQAGAPLLVSVELFDLFRGSGVPAGHKSCAFSLTFRAPERTLTDEEVAEVEARIIDQLGRQTGARVRAEISFTT